MRAVSGPYQALAFAPDCPAACAVSTLSAASARTESSSGNRGLPGGGVTTGGGPPCCVSAACGVTAASGGDSRDFTGALITSRIREPSGAERKRALLAPARAAHERPGQHDRNERQGGHLPIPVDSGVEREGGERRAPAGHERRPPPVRDARRAHDPGD